MKKISNNPNPTQRDISKEIGLCTSKLSRLGAYTGFKFRGGYTKKNKRKQEKPKLRKTKRSLKTKGKL